ncbi:MAG: hypothetical protein ABIR70_17085 [Bryobacteraceae bacterium]
MGAFNPNRFELFSPYPPEECIGRLSAALDVPSKDGVLPIVGTFIASRVWLRKRIWYQNSFQTFLVVSIRPMKRGSAIRGSLGVHGGVWLLFALTYGAILVWALAALRRGDQTGAGVSFGLFSLFGIVLFQFGRLFAREDGPFLKDFVVRTLKAKDSRIDRPEIET